MLCLVKKTRAEIGKIPLVETVVRGISEMSQRIEDRLLQRTASPPFFALQFDDSTDVQELCQLLNFVRYVWNDNVYEDTLFSELRVM